MAINYYQYGISAVLGVALRVNVYGRTKVIFRPLDVFTKIIASTENLKKIVLFTLFIHLSM